MYDNNSICCEVLQHLSQQAGDTGNAMLVPVSV